MRGCFYVDLTAGKEYTYTYEGCKLVRAQEYDATLSGEIVTGRTIVNTIAYFYDNEDRLYKKTISRTGQTIHYETPEDGNTIVKFTAGGKTVTGHSKSDSFGRKMFDELQLGSGFLSREFQYYMGEETDEHTENGKLKSSPITQLVSQIALSGGRTISYEYDAEERITKVIDSVDGVTEYTYDALGQLLTETVNGEVINTMTYDNYGNILTKNGVIYAYANEGWTDHLASVDGSNIFYDNAGNPYHYRGISMEWEKGRQLKRLVRTDRSPIDYTYNANGIRTSKTVNGIWHTYTLDGTKILHEDWGGNSLVPLYDNEDSVCGIAYNGTPYYFQKNLQGDIIAITDKNGDVVARYRYDAWGVPTITMDDTLMNIATVNPFRYRGYYYDTDTGFYYLQSRYYDPEIGRWINADEATYLGASGTNLGFNLFAYCENNPVNYKDPSGNWLIQVICGIAGAAVFGTVANVLCRLLGVNTTVRRLITAGFALLGGILGAAFGPSIVGKIAPKALEWVNKLEKIINSKSNFRPIIFEGQTIIGFEYNNFKIMLHPTHKKEPKKGWHIAVQHKTPFGKWRETIPDIPLKELGKVFMNWAQKWLK